MRVVATIGWGPVSRQGSIAVPSLQGKDRYPNQFTKNFRGICMLHATTLHDLLRKINTAEPSFLSGAILLYGGATKAYASDSGVATSQAIPSASSSQPNFGSNVYIFNPSMPQKQIQATVDAVASQQVSNQFGTQRYALLFEPGTYGSSSNPLNFQVGYYT